MQSCARRFAALGCALETASNHRAVLVTFPVALTEPLPEVTQEVKVYFGCICLGREGMVAAE